MLAQAIKSITASSRWVLFRKPTEKSVHFYLQNTSEKKREGFVIQSFDATQKEYIFPEFSFSIHENDWKELLKISFFLTKLEKKNVMEENAYISLISKTINLLKDSELQKVVLSHTHLFSFLHIDLIASFKNLCTAQPNAFVYLWQLPNQSVWMGATPELLLKKEGKIYKTTALAGTRANDVAWTEKEQEEQKMVTDYILQTLVREKNVQATEPKTISTGLFSHLKTDISFELANENDVEPILKKLHPTPAVCGLPKKTALDYILANENYYRSFYTGYIGLQTKNELALYVNLRCASFYQNTALLYVGGGITTKSNPQKEWQETLLKTKTILSQLSI